LTALKSAIVFFAHEIMMLSRLVRLSQLLLAGAAVAATDAFIVHRPAAPVATLHGRPAAAAASSASAAGATTATQLAAVVQYVRCGQCQSVYAIAPEDFGQGKGRRLECSVCAHSWFQSRDRIMTANTDDCEMVPLPQRDHDRIRQNLDEGRNPKHTGDAKLYVGNISFDCHEDDLFEVFGKAGEVGDVSLVRDPDGNIRGFGFITMRTAEGGERAIAELNGLTVRGRTIAVREAVSDK
jgi:RNA recognition motif. (a.k.a. RRM, RBD, or RNP domain)/zinc-ribbon domain